MQNQLDPTKLVPLSKAARRVRGPSGKPTHTSTLHRWATRGLADVKLQVRYEGGNRLTCQKWIDEFFDAVTAAKLGLEDRRQTVTNSSQSAMRIEAAERALQQAGV